MTKFDEVRKGYSKEQVDAYIQMLADEYEKVLAEKKALEDELDEAKSDKEHGDKSHNEAIASAIISAELASKQIIANAKAEANRISAEANYSMDAVNRKKEVAYEEIKQLVNRLTAIVEEKHGIS